MGLGVGLGVGLGGSVGTGLGSGLRLGLGLVLGLGAGGAGARVASILDGVSVLGRENRNDPSSSLQPISINPTKKAKIYFVMMTSLNKRTDRVLDILKSTENPRES